MTSRLLPAARGKIGIEIVVFDSEDEALKWRSTHFRAVPERFIFLLRSGGSPPTDEEAAQAFWDLLGSSTTGVARAPSSSGKAKVPAKRKKPSS